ncbi:hypothetical protein GCM10012285_61670 [Streptomyces kronopolitis]|uniref:Uncharacterized protein n=1 Tax=Streptomyces kronopolitis TaxID=1612435 RepID=A0ABQ2K0S6_9ACTN|nr:hypothetical protein GCM10012285_61670 [Streptomyces kronopolitis]
MLCHVGKYGTGVRRLSRYTWHQSNVLEKSWECFSGPAPLPPASADCGRRHFSYRLRSVEAEPTSPKSGTADQHRRHTIRDRLPPTSCGSGDFY